MMCAEHIILIVQRRKRVAVRPHPEFRLAGLRDLMVPPTPASTAGRPYPLALKTAVAFSLGFHPAPEVTSPLSHVAFNEPLRIKS